MSNEETLTKTLRRLGKIETNIGDFAFKNHIGNGGNSDVFVFERGGKEFVIKFLKKESNTTKINRFKDEYFCLCQLPENKNIVKYYHLDHINLDENNYYIIIMKRYDKTLKGEFADDSSPEKYYETIKKLFDSLCNALNYIHSNKVIHRDIKPENIFYDKDKDEYILGDFGISKFDDEAFARNSHTKSGERLANIEYSAPEQIDKNGTVNEASDIYSFGQVLQKFATKDVCKGGGRNRLKFINNNSEIKLIDEIIQKCTMHSSENRFSSINEIFSYIKENDEALKRRLEEYNNWELLHKLREAIVKSAPDIKGMKILTEPRKVSNFIKNIHEVFKNDVGTSFFWMTDERGADNTVSNIKQNDNELFEIEWGGIKCDMAIKRVILYNDIYGSFYKNFFMIVPDKMPQFKYSSLQDTKVERLTNSDMSDMSVAIKWNNLYFHESDIQNEYVEIEGKVYQRKSPAFKDVFRINEGKGFLVSPRVHSPYCSNDMPIISNLVNKAVSGEIQESDIIQYLNFYSSNSGYANWVTWAL